jgi:hypothetical protein
MKDTIKSMMSHDITCLERVNDNLSTIPALLLYVSHAYFFPKESFVFGATVPNGPGPPHSRGFKITHNDASQSLRLLWTRDQLFTKTST